MLVILVRFTIRQDQVKPFLERVRVQARMSLETEEGCRYFDVCRDADDPSRVLLYEVYSDEEAFVAHLRSAHFQAFDRETEPWIDEKVVEHWTRIEDR